MTRPATNLFAFAVLILAAIGLSLVSLAYAQDDGGTATIDAGHTRIPSDAEAVDPNYHPPQPALAPIYDFASDPRLFWIPPAFIAMLVWLLRNKALFGRIPWFQTRLGARVLLIATALASGITVAYGSGQGLTNEAILLTLAHAAAAAFGYDLVRDHVLSSANEAAAQPPPPGDR